MYILRPSYAPNWRIFVATENNFLVNEVTVHEYLKASCLWGGADKREIIDGREHLGYEFNTTEAATRIINKIVALGQ
jgi:hypothetical protein